MPTISAVLIVRNEARNIDACLAALKQVADEIVVVDTGSDDDTIDRARRHTAQVHSVAPATKGSESRRCSRQRRASRKFWRWRVARASRSCV